MAMFHNLFVRLYLHLNANSSNLYGQILKLIRRAMKSGKKNVKVSFLKKLSKALSFNMRYDSYNDQKASIKYVLEVKDTTLICSILQ